MRKTTYLKSNSRSLADGLAAIEAAANGKGLRDTPETIAMVSEIVSSIPQLPKPEIVRDAIVRMLADIELESIFGGPTEENRRNLQKFVEFARKRPGS